MSIPRPPSSAVGADLHLVNSRLQELRHAEAFAGAESDRLSLHNTPTASLSPYQSRHDTRIESEKHDAAFDPSGYSTPWEDYTGTNTPNPTRPRMTSTGEGSIMRVKTETKRKWYDNKGVKVTTKHFYQEIDSSWTAVMIVACYFVSGIIDAAAVAVWSCFVSMQTGNTIFLANRIANQQATHHPLNYVKALVSIGCYCLGALAFNCLHRSPAGLSHPTAPLHRWTLFTSFVIQSMLLIIAAVLAQLHILSSELHTSGNFSSGTPENPGDNYRDLLGIGLLAFEAAGQVCLSRVLLINELPTIVLSTLYHDLIGEALSTKRCWRQSKTKWDFVVTQKKQIRRIVSILSLFTGGLVGGFLFQSRAGLAGALWVAAGIKVTISIAWCCWKRKVVMETIVTREPVLQRPPK